MDAHGNATLVDREDECRALNNLLADGSYKLALLTGRRRVGKTFLLTHAWGQQDYFLFTAAHVTGDLNRVQLIRDLAAWTGEDLRPEDYPTWRTVFSLLLGLKGGEPLVIVLDEFQYLAANDHGLAEVASELNAVWERVRQQRPFLLVLSGSAVSTMEALASGGSPLYGRFAWQHRLKPFDYWNTALMTPFGSHRDRAVIYGTFGGTPRYLASIDPKADLATNIQELLLAPDGEVRALVETALDQEEGLREVVQYRSILRAVASGNTLRNEISNATGLPSSQAFRSKLEKLVELGYLESRRNMYAKRSEPVRYYVSDAAVRFHQRFVAPNSSLLERYQAARVWKQVISEEIDGYMGHEFERIVQQAYDRLSSSLDLPLVAQWGGWEGRDRDRRSLEFDIVAELADGRCMTGSIKWNRRPVGPKVYWDHIGMLERAAATGLSWAKRALEPDAPMLFAAAGGFNDAFTVTVDDDGRSVTGWDLEQLYRGLR